MCVYTEMDTVCVCVCVCVYVELPFVMKELSYVCIKVSSGSDRLKCLFKP